MPDDPQPEESDTVRAAKINAKAIIIAALIALLAACCTGSCQVINTAVPLIFIDPVHARPEVM